jgi:hypothetical protein
MNLFLIEFNWPRIQASAPKNAGYHIGIHFRYHVHLENPDSFRNPSCDYHRKRKALIHIDLWAHSRASSFGSKTLKILIRTLLFLVVFFGISPASAEPAPEQDKALDQQVQDLKQAVLELNRELFILEEEMLFPGNTQVSVFLSMDIGNYFKLDSVQLHIDDKELASYLYTEREVKALLRGGVQRLYLGNLKSGEHELVAFFTGIGPNGRDYKRGATVTFSKGIGPKYLELKIVDSVAMQQPDFEVREWE